MPDIYHDSEAEERAIGCAIQFPETLDDFITLKPSDFFAEKNRQIFEGILKTYQAGKEVNVMSLYQLFQKDGTSITTKDLTKRQNEAISSTEILPCIQTLKEYSQRRAIKKVGDYFVQESSKATLSPKEMVEKAATFIEAASVSRKEPVAFSKVLKDRLSAYINNSIKKGKTTGLKEIDDIWAGFFGSELTILAARPSMGKTALAMHMAQNIKGSVLFFSLEMKKDALADRVIAGKIGVDLDDLRRGVVSKEKLKNAQLGENDIYIDDSPSTTTFEIMAQARRMKRKKEIGLIIIDFLTLISEEKERGDNEHQKIHKVTRKIREMANTLDVPVLVLAQLNRGVESRENKRPTMSDLRESGGIEEAADNVLLLYREEYYNPETENKGIVEVIIAKQKQGPRGGTARIYFDITRGEFKNLARRDDYGPAPF